MDRLQAYLEQRESEISSPSSYVESTFLKSKFLKKLKDRMFFLYRSFTHSIEGDAWNRNVEDNAYTIVDGEFKKTNDRVFISNDGILDRNSLDFVINVRKPLSKHESDMGFDVYSYDYSPEDALLALNKSLELLPRLGYDPKLHRFEEMAKELVERYIDSTDFYVSLNEERVMELSAKAKEINARFNIGINPLEKIVTNILDGISSFELHYSLYDRAVEKAELAERINNEFSVGIDVKNLGYGKIIEYLLSEAEMLANNGSTQIALYQVAKAKKINDRYQVGNKEVANLGSRLIIDMMQQFSY